MRASWIVGRVVAPLLAVSAIGALIGSASCAATPTPIPVRTFDRAQKVAFACLHVNDANGNALSAPSTAPEAMCPPVVPNANGALLAYHYYGLVTQLTRGELAVVDLSAGAIVDEDRSTPGVNFIPVGANPTDIVVSPVAQPGDRAFTYVSSFDPNGYALYAIDNSRLLGDSTGTSPPPPLALTDLPACALPQPPIALAIVPSPPPMSPAGDGGVAGGGTTGGCPANYTIAVLLQPGAGAPAQVMMVDPTPFVCPGSPMPGGTTLPLCPQVGGSGSGVTAAGLTGALSSSLGGASLAPGPAWPDGVVYADGGVTIVTPIDAGSADAAPPLDAGTVGLDAADSDDSEAAAALTAGGAEIDSPIAIDAAGTPAGSGAGAPLSVGPLFAPQPTSMVVRDDAPVLYVADGNVPLIHVIDVSNPAAPVEVSSFVATSQAQPSRRVAVGALALSPATSQFDPVTGLTRRYLYAIDGNDGTLMVFDATRPIPPPFTPPMERPHPELNPLAPRDRIAFSAPIAAVTFVSHDWPLFPPNVPNVLTGYSGLICNPNLNARPITQPAEYGAYYGADQASVIEPQGAGVQGFPNRLRGVFGFATLTNGNVIAIDVDDWDAPCRRPDPMDPTHQTGLLDIPEPAAGMGDIDPYHAPTAYTSGSASSVTQETFFPVSSPNRIRSGFLLRNDPTSGEHLPNVTGAPQLFTSAGAPVSGGSIATPIMLPTALPAGFVDPSYYLTPIDPNDNYGSISPGLSSADAQTPMPANTGSSFFPGANTPSAVRISFDDPTAHIDQDWAVTYEGTLPSVSPIFANLDTNDGYQTLVLSVGGAAPDGGPSAANARFCGLGIEDWDLGQARANAAVAEMKRDGLPVPAFDPTQALPQWTADYVELTDDLLASNDSYWTTGLTTADGGPGYDCWAGTGVEGQGPGSAGARYNYCVDAYGPTGADADSHLARDFPILQASDGSLVVGRYFFPGPPANEQTTNRVIVGKDSSNVGFLQAATCCFHHQAGFKIRTGGEWVAVGLNGLGLLHHVIADPNTGRCVPNPDPNLALLQARTFDVPYYDANNACAPPAGASTPLDRTSPLAMRNQVFSFLMWGGCAPISAVQHTTSVRDLNWRFSMRGGFSPLSISLSQATAVTVVPESMAFASAFGQLAVVDGSSQGLILIDLNSLTFAHAPYF